MLKSSLVISQVLEHIILVVVLHQHQPQPGQVLENKMYSKFGIINNLLPCCVTMLLLCCILNIGSYRLVYNFPVVVDAITMVIGVFPSMGGIMTIPYHSVLLPQGP